MAVKRITIRISEVLHQELHGCADAASVSLNTLAERALAEYVRGHGPGSDRLPLGALGDLLAPAAEADGLDEAELMEYAREVRQRIWRDRYAVAVRAHERRQAGR